MLVELEVSGVANGGWCVARHEGRVVFVRHALPGERVRARVTEETARFLRADAVEILSPSPDRVTPPCPYAGPGRCGGCDWQHATPEAQRRLKAAVVAEQFQRLAGITRDVVVEEVPGSPGGLGWRTRVQFAVDRDGRLGLRRHRSHEIERIDHCLIAHPYVEALAVESQQWPGATTIEVVATTPVAPVATPPATTPPVAPATTPPAAEPSGTAPSGTAPDGVETGPSGTAPDGVETGPAGTAPDGVETDPGGVDTSPGGVGPGEISRGGPPDGRSDMAAPGWGGPVTTGKGDHQGSWHGGDRAVIVTPQPHRRATIPNVDAAILLDEGRRGTRALRGRASLVERVGDRDFRVTASGFWQVHPGAAATLLSAVLDFSQAKPGEWALDLYCGVGLFAAGLAEAVGPDGAVLGIESEPPAVQDARRNLRDLPQARIERGRVEEALDRLEIERADLVVADPPRAGLGRTVVDRIATLQASRIVYVSCDPATLARDVKWLAEHGYALTDLRAFDAFPMTHHVECVALLTR